MKNEIKVLAVYDRDEKENIMRKCDHAFSTIFFGQKSWIDTFEKIDQKAEFYCAYKFDEKAGKMPLGYIAFYVNDCEKKIAYITMISILGNAQRQHIGSKLMKLCLERSKECGMKAVRLEVKKENRNAILFYEYWGYEIECEKSYESVYMIKEI